MSISIQDVDCEEGDYYKWMVKQYETTDLETGLIPVGIEPPKFDPRRSHPIFNRFLFQGQGIDLTDYDRNREKFLPLLQTIVRNVWDRFRIPKTLVLEFGPGSTGYFYAKLRPEDVGQWIQLEINPKAIEENKRRNPQAVVFEGDYYDIKHKNIPTICGLSSFDTAIEMDKAIDQVADALMPGGYFLHIQDVNPGFGCTTSYITRATGSYPKECLAFQKKLEKMVAFKVGGEWVTDFELFRRNIGASLGRRRDLDVKLNRYVRARTPIRGNTSHIYFGNDHMHKVFDPRPQRGDPEGYLRFMQTGSAVQAYQEAVVVATVAQKKG